MKQQLAKNKLSTIPYNPHRACHKFPFIDPTFVPPGKADSTEYEGGTFNEASSVHDVDSGDPQEIRPSANSLRITLPRTAVDAALDIDPQAVCNMAPRLVIWIPPLISIADEDGAENLPNAPDAPKRVFCGEEYRDAILTMMERHFCAHPRIPGYS